MEARNQAGKGKTMLTAIREADEEFRGLVWNAQQGNPPFDSGCMFAESREEGERRSRSYQRDRAQWINEQWGAANAAEAVLSQMLAEADIPRAVWDAYAEGLIEEPTCTAYQRACRSFASRLEGCAGDGRLGRPAP